ncbi:MAG: putative nucleotidyltransferase/putative transcriptional regulator [Enterobacterales bacterium]|jgi:predicted nucleotidyltransferase/predicted transcriptional regulator
MISQCCFDHKTVESSHNANYSTHIANYRVINMSKLANALFTTTQQNVLGLLFMQPDKSFYNKEIIRLTGMGVGNIKRELDRMLDSGLISMIKIGNQHHYQANPSCPIYEEILRIAKKTFGLTDAINNALAPLSERVDWAFIFGSVASGKETASSDIDVMVIGDVRFSDVVTKLYPVQETLGREINPKIYSREAWQNLVYTKDAFIREVLSKPRMDIMGDENEFG